MQAYLKRVQEENRSLLSASFQAEAAKSLFREADLLFSPRFFAEVRTGYDEKLASPPIITYDRAESEFYSAGISQNFRFGLETKLSYNMTNSDLIGADTTLLGGRPATFADGVAQLEVSLPLWGNGFGRTLRANEEVTRQQSLANRYSALSSRLRIITDAETAYWRLAAAIEQLKIEEQSLKSAGGILSYVSDKSRKDLGEAADVVQAQALVEAYSLQVQQARNELRAAQRQFNALLNQDPLQAVPALEPLNVNGLQALTVPALRPGDRYDVRATETQALLAQANSTLAAERNKPKLDMYSAYSAYGQDSKVSEAFSQSMENKRNGFYVGVKFSVPLNINALNDARSGAEQNRIASENALTFARYNQEQQWTELVENFNDAKNNLQLAGRIEVAQKAKLENEQKRLRQGRTTTYQVLLFEQDFNQSQSSRLKAATRLISLHTESKIYQVKSEGEN